MRFWIWGRYGEDDDDLDEVERRYRIATEKMRVRALRLRAAAEELHQLVGENGGGHPERSRS